MPIAVFDLVAIIAAVGLAAIGREAILKAIIALATSSPELTVSTNYLTLAGNRRNPGLRNSGITTPATQSQRSYSPAALPAIVRHLRHLHLGHAGGWSLPTQLIDPL